MDRETMNLMVEGKRFLEKYFLEPNPAKSVNLYREDSVMTFDGEVIQGKEAIRAKLTSLQQCRHQALNIECLPVSSTDPSSGFKGLVCGYIWLEGNQDARFFSQMFILHPTPGSFDISHSIFLLGT